MTEPTPSRAPTLGYGVTWPSLDTFTDLARTRRVIPVVRRLLADAETPVGVSASASSLRTTGMTRRVRARSVNVSSEGQVTPYPSVGARLGVGSVIRISLDRAQIVVV